MKEASPDKPSDTLTIPTETFTSKAASAPSTPSLPPEMPRRSRRSVSPKKSRAPKTTTPKAPSSTTGRGRKKKGSTVDEESVASSSPVIPNVVVPKAEKAVDKDVEEEKPVLDSIKVGVSAFLNNHVDFRKMIQQSY